MTPLQASVLLNEAIELLDTASQDSYLECDTQNQLEESLARLRSFRDGFFRHIRTQNNHPVKVPAVPEPTCKCYGCHDTGYTGRGYLCPCEGGAGKPVFDHTRPEGLGVLVPTPPEPPWEFKHS